MEIAISIIFSVLTGFVTAGLSFYFGKDLSKESETSPLAYVFMLVGFVVSLLFWPTLAPENLGRAATFYSVSYFITVCCFERFSQAGKVRREQQKSLEEGHYH